MKKLLDIVIEFEKKLTCDCDLDKWQPEPDTGHSFICRIHIAAKQKYYSQENLYDSRYIINF